MIGTSGSAFRSRRSLPSPILPSSSASGSKHRITPPPRRRRRTPSNPPRRLPNRPAPKPLRAKVQTSSLSRPFEKNELPRPPGECDTLPRVPPVTGAPASSGRVKMPEFHFQEMFPLCPEDVPYRCLTTNYVASGSFAGETIVSVAPDALTLL